MLWKTEEKVLPEEKREEDSGKLMLTGRSVEVRKQGKGVWNAGSGASKAHGGKGVGMGVSGARMAGMLFPADAAPRF